MNTAFLIYLVMQLDSINKALEGFAFLAIILVLASIGLNLMVWISVDERGDKATDKEKENLDYISRIRKKVVVAFLVLVLIVTLTPTTKTAIYMIGGSATIEALQSEEAKEIGGKVLELLQKKLDEELGK